MQRLGSLLAAVFVGVCLGAEPEPTYEGKTLGQWSAQAKDQDPQLREQSARALGRMAEALIQEDPSKPEFRNSKSPANSNDQ